MPEEIPFHIDSDLMNEDVGCIAMVYKLTIPNLRDLTGNASQYRDLEENYTLKFGLEQINSSQRFSIIS